MNCRNRQVSVQSSPEIPQPGISVFENESEKSDRILEAQGSKHRNEGRLHQQKRFMAYATYVAFAAYLDFARLLRPRLRAFCLFSLGFGRWAYLA